MNTETPSIQILLATYNGAPYLAAQLDSLLAQTCRDWRLVVRDDGSSDGTLAIIQSYRSRFPERIELVSGGATGTGAVSNFGALMAAATAPHVMFCDQDDVWLPDKIERTRAVMGELEARHGADHPCLVHTDLRVVGRDLAEMAPSLWRYQRTDPSRIALHQLLVQNVATGCAMMVNRSLLQRALPVPDRAVMHDWWLTLVAAAFGQIGCLDRPTALYRQHGGNDTGAKPLSVGRITHELLHLAERRRITERIQLQAAAFAERFAADLPGPLLEQARCFSRLRNCGMFRRRYYYLKHRFFYAGIVRNAGRLLLG